MMLASCLASLMKLNARSVKLMKLNGRAMLGLEVSDVIVVFGCYKDVL